MSASAEMLMEIYCTECVTSRDSSPPETSKLNCRVSETKPLFISLSFSLGEKAPQAPLFAYGKASKTAQTARSCDYTATTTDRHDPNSVQKWSKPFRPPARDTTQRPESTDTTKMTSKSVQNHPDPHLLTFECNPN